MSLGLLANTTRRGFKARLSLVCIALEGVAVDWSDSRDNSSMQQGCSHEDAIFPRKLNIQVMLQCRDRYSTLL